MDLQDWLNSLNEGCEWTAVIHSGHSSVGRAVKVKVVRRTTTQIIAMVDQKELRYRTKDGRLVGDKWGAIPPPASEKVIAEIQHENLRLNMAARLRECDFKKLPYETLESMFKLLPST